MTEEAAQHPQMSTDGRSRKARGQGAAGDPQVLLEVLKARHTAEGIAQDQHRPPLANQVEGLRYRAVHRFKRRFAHDSTVRLGLACEI